MYRIKFCYIIILLLTLSLLGLVFFIYQKNAVQKDILEQFQEEIKLRQATLQLLKEKIRRFSNIEDSLRKNLSNIDQQVPELPEYLKGNRDFIPDQIPIEGDFALSQDYNSDHKAIDFASSSGHKVLASASGIVTDIYEDKYFGKVIIIDHLNYYKSFYAHLDSFLCKKREFVRKNDVIATVGNTGNSSSPHLHFQIYFKKTLANPHDLIKIPKVNIEEKRSLSWHSEKKINM